MSGEFPVAKRRRIVSCGWPLLVFIAAAAWFATDRRPPPPPPPPPPVLARPSGGGRSASSPSVPSFEDVEDPPRGEWVDGGRSASARSMGAGHIDARSSLLEPPGSVVNVARRGTAALSSTEGFHSDPTGKSAGGSLGCQAGHAIDGKASGIYHKTCGKMAITNVETAPWVEVRLPDDGDDGGGGGHRVWSVEVWAGMRRCDSVKFGAKAGCAQMEVGPQSGPLVVTLFGGAAEEDEDSWRGDPGGSEEGGSEEGRRVDFPVTKTFDDQRLVYSWDGIDARGVRAVRVHLPGENRQLAVTQVKVFAVHPDPAHVPERCAQDSDVWGDDCATDLRVDWVHLPQGTRGARRAWDAELFSSLMKDIETNQALTSGGARDTSPAADRRCKAPYVESVNVGMGGKGAGLASTVHFISGLLTEGYVKRKPFVFGGRLNYATNAHCAAKGLSGDFECYVKPFSGCEAAKNTAFAKWRAPYSRNNRCAIGRLCNDLSQFKMLPKGPFGGKGLFWFRSAMVMHIMRLSEETHAALALEQLKRRIGWGDGPIIGVHVRHGDACHTTLRKGMCKGIGVYLPHIRLLSEKYGTRRVYLATDDAAVIKSVSSPSVAAEFDFIYITEDDARKLMDDKQLIERRTDLYKDSSSSGHTLMMSALVDLLLLTETDAFVGHFLSNLSRLAVEMMAAKKGYLPPYVSMDGPWCPHWKMCVR